MNERQLERKYIREWSKGATFESRSWPRWVSTRDPLVGRDGRMDREGRSPVGDPLAGCSRSGGRGRSDGGRGRVASRPPRGLDRRGARCAQGE